MNMNVPLFIHKVKQKNANSRFLPLSAHSLVCTAFSSADAHMPSLSLPMLCSDVGFRSILLSGWGWEDMGMPYRKLESIELLADAS